jgi:hypothetical protein
VKRRELLLLLGGAMSAARALNAQQKAIPLIGLLGVTSPDLPLVALNLHSFWQGLSSNGVRMERSCAAGSRSRMVM